jgi:hypothetical protein
MVSVMGSLGKLDFVSALSCLRVRSMLGSQVIKKLMKSSQTALRGTGLGLQQVLSRKRTIAPGGAIVRTAKGDNEHRG